jgi:2-polyprenyl-3-methyl-5-hydroxy-6-metoxy-1,4-benzoquinol methylase
MVSNYLERNRDHWDAMVDAHWESEFYDVAGWLEGRERLPEIDAAMLPVLEGKRLLHLQCHFGQDTLTLARRGAIVTGADISSRAIERANELAKMASLQGTFVLSDVYGLPERLEGQFDVVYTSWGTIGWLPDLQQWAGVLDHFLAPGGTFVLAEFHPVVWMYGSDRSRFEYSYFNRGPITEEGSESYSGDEKPKTTEIGWNHPLTDVLGALLGRGLSLEAFEEYDYSPHDCFADTVQIAPRKYQWRGFEGVLPMSYALRVKKPG